MYSLCTITREKIQELFGSDANTPPPNLAEDFGLILVAAANDNSSFLVLVTKTNMDFVKQSSIPDGYRFTFRQAWGMTINEETLHRIVSTLRAEAYPPMSDYLDAKVKGDTAQEQAYLDACAAVKAKYPKFSF